ncbi:hypothetical protein [Micropruina sp.]|uniref:hypothetical protein n=1 Tax=Micropruina sp. TaxID=2737536 RepID=UPI0039E2858B
MSKPDSMATVADGDPIVITEELHQVLTGLADALTPLLHRPEQLVNLLHAVVRETANWVREAHCGASEPVGHELARHCPELPEHTRNLRGWDFTRQWLVASGRATPDDLGIDADQLRGVRVRTVRLVPPAELSN